MKTTVFFIASVILLASSFLSSGLYHKFVERAEVVNHYEKAALKLAKENRILTQQLAMKSYTIKELENRKVYLETQLAKMEGKKSGMADRHIASLIDIPKYKNDYVKFETFKWNPNQLVKLGSEAFRKEEYEKSSQFFHTLLTQSGKSKVVNDKILLQAGVAAFEAGKNYDWAVRFLDRLIFEFPTSKHFRSAKLWKGLAHLKLGDYKNFYQTVEEFRMKYRNTEEWKIISGHYEEIRHKFK